MGSIGRIFSGIFGGGKPKQPAAVIQQPIVKQKETQDPNQSSAVAQARRRRVELGKRTGRSALRIDLANANTTTRSGVSINS